MKTLLMACVTGLALLATPLAAQSPAATGSTQPTELGEVHWLRDLDAALAESRRTAKPVLILFQEVPGCSNCTRYGREILSNPLIVESMESDFVPLAIYNNRGGKDAAALKRYGEPAWNNPVVRIINANGQDLVPRMPDFRSAADLTGGMLTALDKHCGKSPLYLQILHEEQRAREGSTDVATFETACFWSGEAYFGAQEGVVATEAGWQKGQEVVRVRFNRAVTSEQILAKAAASQRYAVRPNGSFRVDREPKYYLLKSRYAAIPMPELQAARVNAMLGQGKRPDALLSPRQLKMLDSAG